MVSVTELFVLLTICLIGIVGFSCAIISLRIIYNRPFLHNAFGYICAAHTIAEAGILLCFVFWSIPIILFSSDSSLSQNNIAGAIFGLFINWLYYSSFVFLFVKSLNRLCATVFFIKYRIIFSNENAKVFIGIVAGISLCIISPMFKYECNLLFNAESFAWQIRDESCSALFGTIDIAVTAATPALAFISDIITFCFLRFKLNNKSSATISRDMRFFAQTCVSTIVYVQMFVTFYFISPLTLNSAVYVSFMSTTMAWLLGHTLNQISFIMFNAVFVNEPKVKIISSLSPATKFVTNATHA